MAFDTFKINMGLFFKVKNGSASGQISAEDMPAPFMVDILDDAGNIVGQEFDGGESGVDFEMRKLARKITDEYHKSIATAYQQVGGTARPINPALYNGAMNAAKEGIFLAIFNVLKIMHSTGAKPSIAMMLPIGVAVVAYWTVALTPGSFLPVPMPLTPVYTSPAPGTLVIFPGNPRPIAKGFKDAFSKHDNEREFNTALVKMLNDLVEGFENHLASISGVYVGLVPVPPVVIPMVTPWKGIKV